MDIVTHGLRLDPIEAIVENSFRNFHAKGLDYLCLQRSEILTVKAYFYDCDQARSPEVVCPHDHRYPFVTQIVAGESNHWRYVEMPEFVGLPKRHQCFKWRTPLLGGNGFEWSHEAALERVSHERYSAGEAYWCRAEEIHTIGITTPGTVLLLIQMADVVPIGEPTHTYVMDGDKEPPSLSGLYDRMTPDHARALLARLLVRSELETNNVE
jgi:hypothetical protein